jgi:SAM-dependent methyltransferase
MANFFEFLSKVWPERESFQGSARAYISFCESSPESWEYLEAPMWMEFFTDYLLMNEAIILDLGAGCGKLTELAIKAGTEPKNIFALEPNSILLRALFDKSLGVGCIQAGSDELGDDILKNIGFNLIMSNMVASHLTTEQFNNFILKSADILSPGGVLAYSTPNPVAKAQKFKCGIEDNFYIGVEEAPWGGLTPYHHRSISYQMKAMRSAGFKPSIIQCGDNLIPFSTSSIENTWNGNVDLNQFKRVLFWGVRERK